MYILQKSISQKTYLFLVILFLAILGSHLFDDKIYLFVIVSIFLIDWKNFFSKDVILVGIFLLSIYSIWFYLDSNVLFKIDAAIKIISQLVLLFFIYLLGYSINLQNNMFQNTKYVFYLLFSFVIAYSLMIIYSYFAIKQDIPITSYGLFVNFPNEYKRLNVNGGRLISTIIAYELTIMSVLVAYFLIYFDTLRKKNFFTLSEIFLLSFISIFALYITALMGRRISIILFIFISALLFIFRIVFDSNIKQRLYLIVLFIILLISLYFFSDTIKNHFLYAYNRVVYYNFHDRRFSYWMIGLQAISHYPFGGGHDIFVGPNTKMAHNTWIDIGKDFGVIPFFLFIFITLLHIYYFLRILFNTKLNILIKYQLIIILLCIFSTLMIEPVFNSDKTFIAYLFFIFGMIARYYNSLGSGKL